MSAVYPPNVSDSPVSVLHLSLLVGSTLMDSDGEKLGRVDDVIVRLGVADSFPPLTGLMVRIARRQSFLPIDRVESMSHDGIRLRRLILSLRRFERRPDEVLLREDMLDRQLINVDGARLVRANDIEIARVAGAYRVVGVDIEFRALVRRLLPRRIGRSVAAGEFISWESVEPFVGHVPTVRLRVAHPKLARLHPAQIADLVEAASHAEGGEIIRAVGQDHELEADVFEELDARHKLEFIAERSDAQAAKLLANMESDDASHLLADMPVERQEAVMRWMPPDRGRKVRALLGYDAATAGGLMSPDAVTCAADEAVEDVLRRVAASPAPEELLTTVYVVDADRRITGLATMPGLLRADGASCVGDAAHENVVTADADAPIAEVARLMADYDLLAVPVVDEAGLLVGAVTVDDVLEIIMPTSWRRRFGIIGGD
jgi:CBS domain-containing protein